MQPGTVILRKANASAWLSTARLPGAMPASEEQCPSEAFYLVFSVALIRMIALNNTRKIGDSELLSPQVF
jgi:hypothetical protein